MKALPVRRSFAPPRADAAGRSGEAAYTLRDTGRPFAEAIRPAKMALPSQWPSGQARPSGALEALGVPAAVKGFASFGDALERYYWAEARLPPASGTGFDPSLTPAWAGVKLPL
ncbi:MAG: hypothetical protein B7Z80_26205 [Rhodospirillales bacterium 20-64-7]|nr:MAG: hypothetical protein B7Z80_26205 [Rhodospirillales bacterium 20-64-7]